MTMHVIDHVTVSNLIHILKASGFTTIGPVQRDGVLTLDEISGDDLPTGIVDEQAPATYALKDTGTPARFAARCGPQSLKRFLYPPRQKMFSVTKEGKGFAVQELPARSARKYAFIGVRPCDLQALAILDEVFLAGEFKDPVYASLRKSSFIVAVHCLHPGNTCFCASMNSGPRATSGYDIALTELTNGPECRYLVETGSEAGAEMLSQLSHREATPDEIELQNDLFEAAEMSFRKSVDLNNINQLFNEHAEHIHWDDIAKRCLACTNCTMVCPTCFCSTVEDVTDLAGESAHRERRWDSCFTADYTKIAGGNIRMSTRTRYRQWLSHKFAHWQDQFGTYGCVGCGRCITWCPAAIDITKELAALRQNGISSTTP